MARHLHRGRDAGGVYRWRLLRGDYRLAAIRYALAMEPVDDLWYNHRQVLSNCVAMVNMADLDQRILQARRAYLYAMHKAKELDMRFQCDWRQREVQSRLDRLREIHDHIK